MAIKLSSLIDKHRKYYERNEKKAFDKARRYYRGSFFSAQDSTFTDTDNMSKSLLCSKNLIYAIADTAVSALLGPNPQVAANPRSIRSQEVTPAVNGLMEWTFKILTMRVLHS